MHSNSVVDWQCDICGRAFKNVVLPVHHNCKSRGLGDTVAKVLSSVGVKKKLGCGCAERQAKLNDLVPYKRQDKTGL